MRNEHHPNSPRIIDVITTSVVFFSIFALSAIRGCLFQPVLPTVSPLVSPQITALQVTATLIEIGSSSSLVAEDSIRDTICAENNTVDYILVNIDVNGGTKPYLIQVVNMVGEADRPHVIQDGEPILVKIYAGESVRVKLWSYGEMDPDWEKILSASLTSPSCIRTSTPIPAPPNTSTPAMTLTTSGEQ